MSDSVFVGTKAGGLETSPQFEPISKIILLVDNENYFEAGNDTGRTLEITCPYGTQAMANNLLSSLGGYAYQPATATDALIDPAAELGDAVTVGGIYTVLAQMDTTFDSLMTADIGAPGQEEIESEYPYVSQQQSDINRQLADTRSEIAKNSEQIQLTVEGLKSANQAISQLTLSIDSIELSVSNGSTSSTITLKKDNVVISSQEITMSGLVTFTGLANGTTTINGGCIKTGTIDADRLNLTGAITFGDLSTSVQNDINDAYSMAEDAQAAVGDISDTVDDWSYRYGGTTYIDGTKIMAGTVTASTLQGGSVELLNSSGGTAGMMYLRSASSASYAVGIDSYGAMSLEASGTLHLSGDGVIIDLGDNYIGCGKTLRPAGDSAYDVGTASWRWRSVYAQTGTIQTSDRNYKTDIDYDMSRYGAFFDALRPASCKYIDGTSGRRHIVMVSQDVEQELIDSGLTSMDFAGFVKSPMTDEDGNEIDGQYRYFLRYDEFIGLLIWQVQELKKRVAQLEAS